MFQRIKYIWNVWAISNRYGVLIPWILVILLFGAGVFGASKLIKQAKYKKDVKKERVTYADCVAKSRSHIELHKCRMGIK